MLLVFPVEAVHIRVLTVRCPTYGGALIEQNDFMRSSKLRHCDKTGEHAIQSHECIQYVKVNHAGMKTSPLRMNSSLGNDFFAESCLDNGDIGPE